jgi:hypothetical protein
MFCKYCGNQLPETANFCPKCGKINDAAKATAASEPKSEPAAETATFFSDAANDYVPVEPVNVEEELERSEREGSILKMAILGLAFAWSGFLSLLGLIFSIIARAKISAYVRDYGETRGRASVGKGLSIGGLISSIFWMAFFLLYTIIIVAVILGAM